jgi:fatty acid desaturase
MQAHLTPTIDHARSREIWLAMLRQIEQAGLDRPDYRRLALKLLALTAIFGAALAVAWLGLPPSWRGTIGEDAALVGAIVVLALVMAQFAFCGHDAGHGSMLGTPPSNRAAGQLCMTVVLGLAFDEWIGRHRSHHQYCQNEERDPDMDVAVVVSLTRRALAGKGSLGLFCSRYQHLHIWLLAFVFGYSQRHLSQLGALRAPRRFGLDLASLALHFALWILLPRLALDVSWWRVALVYCAPVLLLGPYLAAIFWVNHIGMPLAERLSDLSFVEHQARTSRTILGPRWLDWFFGGLNYQIEHHLYPQVPACRLRSVQRLVQKRFAKERIPYNGVGFGAAVGEIASHLRAVARAVPRAS